MALMVLCPNTGCGESTERRQVKNHDRECPYNVIPCKYKTIECDVKLKRKDMAAHEENHKLHLSLAVQAVNTLQIKVDMLTSKTFVFTEYQKRRDAGEVFQFPPFYTHPRGYHTALRVRAFGDKDGKGTHVTVYAPILEGVYDSELKWPLVGNVKFTLLNQLEDRNHHSKTMSIYPADDADVGDYWGISRFIRNSALAHDPVKKTQYLMNDTLYFRVSMEVANRKPWLE
jgi:hypothetical protein